VIVVVNKQAAKLRKKRLDIELNSPPLTGVGGWEKQRTDFKSLKNNTLKKS
jgi:hypothetical protein